MKKFIYLILLIGIGHFSVQAQCPAETPTITNITTNGSGADVTFSIDCNARIAAGGACLTNAESVIWHVAFIGHGSPAPNGTVTEYGSGIFFGDGCDFTQVVQGGAYATGNTLGAACLEPKYSTCRDQELGENLGGGITGSFSIEEICNAGGSLTYTISGLCDGQTYDVYVWEMIVGMSPTDDPSSGTGVTGHNSIEEAVACGSTSVTSESLASSVWVYQHTGVLAPMNPPEIVVSGLATCGGDGTYTSTHQSIPDNISANNGNTNGSPGCLTTTDINTDGTTGVIAPNTIPSDISFTDATTMGPNTVLVACDASPSLAFPTPTGCKGVNTLNNRCQEMIDAGITTYTNAAMYMWVEDITTLTPVISDFDVPNFNADFSETSFLLGPNSTSTYPTCFDDVGNGMNACTPVTDATYPNNYTGSFGNFVTAAGCNVNFSGGNPLDGTVSVFDLPGSVTIIDANGVSRASTVVCIQYEDDCAGTKSRTCMRFVSADTPIEYTSIIAVDESCSGAADGTITIEGLVGGSQDADQDGDLAGGLDYIFSPNPGSGFTQVGTTSTWVATDVPTGSYDITITDPNAPADCTNACDITFSAVVREKLPSTVEGTYTICPGQCTQVAAEMTENPIVNYELTGMTNEAGANAPCDASSGNGITQYNVPIINNATAANGALCSTAIGTGSTDATILEVCLELESTDFSSLVLYLFSDGGAAREYLYCGAGFNCGATSYSGTGTGTGTLSFCTSTPIEGVFDGVFDGVSQGLGAGFGDPSTLYIQVLDGNGCGTTLTSASVTITDRCQEPQTAVLCTVDDPDTGAINETEVSWVFNSGPSDIIGSGDFVLEGPTFQSGEACGGDLAPGDYVYDVTGYHVATGVTPLTCCPATGQVTITVLDVPAPPTPSLNNGDEFCSTDAPQVLVFSPALDINPGAVELENYLPGGFPDELIIGLYNETTTGSGVFDNLLTGSDAQNLNCGTGTVTPNIDVVAATMQGLAPGDYQLCFAELFGDGLNSATFTFLDQCGNLLFDHTNYAGCGPSLCATFTVEPNVLMVSGDGVTLVSDSDADPTNGNEIYTFDPSIANIAAADGSSCGENLITYNLATSCGCVIDETIAIFVYPGLTASDPPAKTEADCNLAVDPPTVTFTLADIVNGADAVAGTADDLMGGTGSYLMSYDNGLDPAVVNAPLGDVTIPSNGECVTLSIIDDDAVYTSTTTDPTDPTLLGMLTCDGNACGVTVELCAPLCLPPCPIASFTCPATVDVCGTTFPDMAAVPLSLADLEDNTNGTNNPLIQSVPTWSGSAAFAVTTTGTSWTDYASTIDMTQLTPNVDYTLTLLLTANADPCDCPLSTMTCTLKATEDCNANAGN